MISSGHLAIFQRHDFYTITSSRRLKKRRRILLAMFAIAASSSAANAIRVLPSSRTLLLGSKTKKCNRIRLASIPNRQEYHNSIENDVKHYKLQEDSRKKITASTRTSSHTDVYSDTSDASQTPIVEPSFTTKTFKRLRTGVSSMITGLGFVSSATRAFLADRKQSRIWKPAVDSLRNFLKDSGIDLELSQTLNVRLLDNSVILGRVQKVISLSQATDVRDLALRSRSPRNDKSVLHSVEEYRRYVTFTRTLSQQTS